MAVGAAASVSSASVSVGAGGADGAGHTGGADSASIIVGAGDAVGAGHAAGSRVGSGGDAGGAGGAVIGRAGVEFRGLVLCKRTRLRTARCGRVQGGVCEGGVQGACALLCWLQGVDVLLCPCPCVAEEVVGVLRWGGG